MQTTSSLLVPPHTVRQFHTNLSPPDVQFLAPFCEYSLFAPRSSISGHLPLCAALGGGQRQETVVSPCGGALFMENSCPPRHHVVFPKIWDLLLFILILLLLCSPFILSQMCIQLSRSRRGFRWPGCEVSRVRGSLTEISSIYLAVRASHRAQIAATMDNLFHKLATIVLKSRREHAGRKLGHRSSLGVNHSRVS